MMKNCGENFTHVPKSKTNFIDSILKRQKQIRECFLKHKEAIHAAEDPDFLRKYE